MNKENDVPVWSPVSLLVMHPTLGQRSIEIPERRSTFNRSQLLPHSTAKMGQQFQFLCEPSWR